MTDLLEEVKRKIERLSRQIEVRSGANFHDESKTVLILGERLGVYEDLLPDISSLITTIESERESRESASKAGIEMTNHLIKQINEKDKLIELQKETIKKTKVDVLIWKDAATFAQTHKLSTTSLQREIESLKAITELALKELNRQLEASHVFEGMEWTQKAIKFTLSEIERLQNDSTS